MYERVNRGMAQIFQTSTLRIEYQVFLPANFAVKLWLWKEYVVEIHEFKLFLLREPADFSQGTVLKNLKRNPASY